MADAGLALPEENIAYAWYAFEDGYRGMETLLGRNLGITAAFVFSDEMAAGAMACLHDHGVKTPDDISVLGFDNGSQALETRPALSTVAQPVEQIARRSIDKLLEPGGQNVESISPHHCHSGKLPKAVRTAVSHPGPRSRAIARRRPPLL